MATLGKLVNQQEQEPVIIGICYGFQKPTNLVEYLTEFVTETNTLEETQYYLLAELGVLSGVCYT